MLCAASISGFFKHVSTQSAARTSRISSAQPTRNQSSHRYDWSTAPSSSMQITIPHVRLGDMFLYGTLITPTLRSQIRETPQFAPLPASVIARLEGFGRQREVGRRQRQPAHHSRTVLSAAACEAACHPPAFALSASQPSVGRSAIPPERLVRLVVRESKQCKLNKLHAAGRLVGRSVKSLSP
jgi:hypothetical protein